MRQIPASLLPSTATWRAPKGGRSGAGEYEDESHTVSRVRLDQTRSQVVREASVHDPWYGTLYVDARASEGEVPPLGALVSVDGGPELLVRAVEPMRDLGGHLHHTEVTLG